jgi:hypothetical protein
MARLDHSDKDVKIDKLTCEIFNDMPKHRKGTHLTPEYEYKSVNYFTGNKFGDDTTIKDKHNRSSLYDSGFYDHDHFNENKFYQKKESNLI